MECCAGGVSGDRVVPDLGAGHSGPRVPGAQVIVSSTGVCVRWAS